MRIDRIELFHVAMPLIYPWRTAYGEDAACHSVLCRMTSGSVEAWGESSPLAAPCYSPEWAGGNFAVVRDWLAPAVGGQDITSGQQLQQRLGLFKGNPFAKAVLDCAWWAMAAKLANRPLHELLGSSQVVGWASCPSSGTNGAKTDGQGAHPTMRSEVPVGADF